MNSVAFALSVSAMATLPTFTPSMAPGRMPIMSMDIWQAMRWTFSWAVPMRRGSESMRWFYHLLDHPRARAAHVEP